MGTTLVKFLKRSRENYYLSHILSSISKPVAEACGWCGRQLHAKVRRNGAAVRLPNGATMRIAKDSGVGIASALFWHGLAGFESETSRTLRFFFERSSVFVDVGANYGFYSVLSALWNPKLSVIAFEPVQTIFEGLKKNVVLNCLADRIVCENMALGSHSGAATLFLPPREGKDLESTGTLARDSWQVRHNSLPVQVEAMRLDDYESMHSMRIDLVKIDVEDFEAEVLAGMAGIIRRDRPFIVCEILPRNREHKNERTRQILETLGYTPYWISHDGYIRVSRFDFERDLTDFLLSPIAVPGEVVVDPTVFWDVKRKESRVSAA
jgi:FkbM family methyltransferase